MGDGSNRIGGRQASTSRTTTGRNRGLRAAKYPLRPLIVLEVGAGGPWVGLKAGSFVRCLGTNACYRRALLRYVNRRPVRGEGPPFRVLGFLSSDVDRNPANDLRMNALTLPIASDTVHLVVSIGPRGYGFRNGCTAKAFLSEMARVLRKGGELLVMGSYVNPWFNLNLGSREGRRLVGRLARQAGLRTVNYLLPLGKHPVSSLLRDTKGRAVQYRTNGKPLRPPSNLHRFAKPARP